MSIAIIYTILSFLLDGLISNYQAYSLIDPSYFKTIFSIISLVVLYEYFDNKTKCLYIFICLGALYDITYTNTFAINIVIFYTIYLFLKRLDHIFTSNVITINIKSIICISTYYIMTYVILMLFNYNDYSLKLLWMIILRNLIMTIAYTTLSYYIIKLIYSKKDINKIK